MIRFHAYAAFLSVFLNSSFLGSIVLPSLLKPYIPQWHSVKIKDMQNSNKAEANNIVKQDNTLLQNLPPQPQTNDMRQTT